MEGAVLSEGVSVVVTTSGRPAEALARALSGVRAQTMAPSLVVVVYTGTDDAAAAEKEKVLKETLALPSEFLRLPGARAGPARNLGASRCSTRALCFLDDDDEWCPRKLESQYAALGGNALVASAHTVEDPGRTFEFPLPTECGDPSAAILGENIVGSTSFPMASKEAFDAAGGFDPGFASNQEWDLWARMLRAGTLAVCAEPAGVKHSSEGSVSSSNLNRLSGWIRMLGKHSDEYRAHPEQLHRALWHMYGELWRRRMYVAGGLTYIRYRAVGRRLGGD